MENKRIYLASPHMSNEGYEQQYIKEAFDTNWLSSVGANLDNFESEFVTLSGAKAAIALSSGTAAMHLALKALDIGKDDIVLCQSLTFAATVNPVLYENATPVFIDSEQDTWNMSPEALRVALVKYPDAKAVILVHLYGIPARIDEIQSICKEYGIPLIEDAAESVGSYYHGKHTGSFGEFGIISFNGNKIITTSGGGMLLFNGDDYSPKSAKVKFWSTQARDQAPHYQHSEIGYNYRMSNILAGVGRGQLKILSQRVAQKQAILSFYKKELGELASISFMPTPPDTECNCWLSCIILDPSCKVKPMDIITALSKENIEARPIWKPMHMQPVFAAYDYFDNGGIAQYLFENGVCLPSDTNMDMSDLKRIATIIQALF